VVEELAEDLITEELLELLEEVASVRSRGKRK
jgi:hypothetical protein